MTSLTPTRDAAIQSIEKMRIAFAADIAAGGMRQKHAELTIGLNSLLVLHIAECRDEGIDANDSYHVVENAVANAIGTLVMTGSSGDPQEAGSVWAGLTMEIINKSGEFVQRALNGTARAVVSTEIQDSPHTGRG